MTSQAMDSLPRVPDAHGDNFDEKLFSDLYIRTTWIDAQLGLHQIEKGKALGNRTSIYLRSVFQAQLESLGSSIQKHAGKVLFVAILVLSTFCVGLKSIQIHSKVQQLWIQEGGRLETELSYTQATIGEAESSTHQLLIQTARDPNASILHAQALLTHLDVLKKATGVKVHMFDTDWSLRDMCNSPTTPSFEVPYFIEQIFKHLIPCSIITPLDCFWEGSQLLGPEFPVQIPGVGQRITWSTLNPSNLMNTMQQQMRDQKISFDFGTMEQYMKRAGINSGYTEKPCLNPKDIQCPNTAPNKNSERPVDVGAILTGGCSGFASKYMHWPEELIIGGVQRNRSGYLQWAKGLQTVVQLMTEKEMFDLWNNNYKVHHIGWSVDKAAEVLNAWQRNFTQVVDNLMSNSSIAKSYDVYVFSSASLDDILKKFSNPSPISIVISVIVTVFYTFCTLIRWRDPVRGQSSVGVAGVLLIGLATAAGLGFCAILGIAFNAASTQVVPFLALGVGVDQIFMLTAAYAESSRKEHIKFILKKVGPSILFNACITAGSFFAAVFIPVPALKMFCLQAGIVICFNLGAALLVFPAMISLDLRRRNAGRADIFCCCFPIWKEKPINAINATVITSIPIKTEKSSVTSTHMIGEHEGHKYLPNIEIYFKEYGNYSELDKTKQNGMASTHKGQKECLLTYHNERNLPVFSLGKFALKYYTPFLMKAWVKFLVIVIFLSTVIFSLYAITKLQEGLDLIDVVPKETNEYKFLSAQSTMFGFYSMHAVTKGNFEYPNNQRLLHEYHDAFIRVPHVIRNDNGGLPEFWLTLFRDWLQNLQKIFDREFEEGRLNQEHWFSNASSDAILAYKLLVQTGYVDNPVDKSLVTQHKLVDDNGIINPKAFYNYLSAWATNDVFAYGASQGKLYPEPRQYYHVPTEYELKIPKSSRLMYAQMPFYLHGLTETSEIKSLITHIRDLSTHFEAKGLPNYPSGIPFIFWEQYMTLRSSLALILCCCLLTAFVLVTILLLSIWAAVLVLFSVLAALIQMFGAMTLMSIKLSALPSVILIFSVGMIICFTVHISLGFMTAVGNRERRIYLSLQMSLGPLTHGILTSALAVLMLSSSPFEFVIRHFFWLLLAMLCVNTFNSLMVFPIILSIIGPGAELIPLEHADRISTPSPILPRNKRKWQRSSTTQNDSRVGAASNSTCSNATRLGAKSQCNTKDINVNNPSLTTITEEPPSWKSSSSSIHINNDCSYNSSSGGNSNSCYANNLSHVDSNINNYQYQHGRQPVISICNANHACGTKGICGNYHIITQNTPIETNVISSAPKAHCTPQLCTISNEPDVKNTDKVPINLQSIVVQPEVTVETHHPDNNTTKVTATANIKVELLAPGRSVRSYNISS